MDANDRKDQRGKTGQRGEISNKGTVMTLVEGETHKETNIPTGTTGMKGSLSITTTVDQREVLLAESSSQRRRPKISDQQNRTLGAAQKQWSV